MCQLLLWTLRGAGGGRGAESSPPFRAQLCPWSPSPPPSPLRPPPAPSPSRMRLSSQQGGRGRNRATHGCPARPPGRVGAEGRTAASRVCLKRRREVPSWGTQPGAHELGLPGLSSRPRHPRGSGAVETPPPHFLPGSGKRGPWGASLGQGVTGAGGRGHGSLPEAKRQSRDTPRPRLQCSSSSHHQTASWKGRLEAAGASPDARTPGAGHGRVQPDRVQARSEGRSHSRRSSPPPAPPVSPLLPRL